MAVLVYKPEGVPEDRWQRWDIDPERMLSSELELIEDTTGLTAAEWIDRFSRGSVKAIHAALWVFLRRKDQTLAYESVQFTMGEVDLEGVEDEAAEVKAAPKARKAQKPRSGNPSAS